MNFNLLKAKMRYIIISMIIVIFVSTLIIGIVTNSEASSNYNVTLAPGDTYYIKINDTTKSLDQTIFIRIPEKGEYILYVVMYNIFSIEYPLERDLRVYIDLKLYDQNDLPEEKIIKAVNDESVVATYYTPLYHGIYKLKIKSNKLEDSVGSSYLKIDWIVIIVSESTELVFMDPGQGVGFPQYITGGRKDIDYFIITPFSSYESWNRDDVLSLLINRKNTTSSFFIDKFIYDRDIKCYKFIDQQHIKINGNSALILTRRYKPLEGKLIHLWNIYDQPIYFDPNDYILLYPYHAFINSTIDLKYSSILPFEKKINAYGVYFDIGRMSKYVLYISSDQPVDLEIYRSSVIKDYGSFILSKKLTNIRKTIYELKTNLSTDFILPVVIWHKGIELPTARLIFSLLNYLSVNTELAIPLDSSANSWSMAYKLVNDSIAYIKPINTEAHIVYGSVNQIIEKFLPMNQSILLDLRKNSYLILYGYNRNNNASIIIKTLKKGVYVNDLNKTTIIQINNHRTFSLLFNMVNNLINESEITILVNKPDYIDSMNGSEINLHLSSLENRNITLTFKPVVISKDKLSIIFLYNNRLIHLYNALLDWDVSFINIKTSTYKTKLLPYEQTIISINIHNNYTLPLKLYIDVKSLNSKVIGIVSPDKVVNNTVMVKPGDNTFEYIVTGLNPGQSYVEIDIYEKYPPLNDSDHIYSYKVLFNVYRKSKEENITTTSPIFGKPIDDILKLIDQYSLPLRIMGGLITAITAIYKILSRLRRRK